MKTLRIRIGAALMVAMLALSVLGGAAQAQNGGDDPCPHQVEVGPGCH